MSSFISIINNDLTEYNITSYNILDNNNINIYIKDINLYINLTYKEDILKIHYSGSISNEIIFSKELNTTYTFKNQFGIINLTIKTLDLIFSTKYVKIIYDLYELDNIVSNNIIIFKILKE